MEHVDPLKQTCWTCENYSTFDSQRDGHCNYLDSWVRSDWTGCGHWKALPLEPKEADSEDAPAPK